MNTPEDIVEILIEAVDGADKDYQNPNTPSGVEAYVRQCLLPQLELHQLTVTRSDTPAPTDFVTAVHIAFDRNSRPRLTIEVQ